ncbi:hypothetical protein FBZ83_12620 [Azospirillum brasilense]|uniref:DUF927 domain-containing protein n=1 Tax=Azospirillum brasilense TaxID=192 RepID=A0A560BMW0_AZOBR|nr:hypothetical protein [Azospirillum brasilense]TWA73953.1 hypothetical protein FBZ83_12620 [Azospirillum brasilense]
MLKSPPIGLGSIADATRVIVTTDSEARNRLAAALPGIAVLAGRPDFDWSRVPAPGRKLVTTDPDIGQALYGAGADKVAIADLDAVLAAAEAGTIEERLASIGSACRKLDRIEAAPQATPTPDIDPLGCPPARDAEADDPGPPIYDDGLPYRALGYNRRRYYFIRRAGGQIVDLASRDLKEIACLMELAPADFWQQRYPGGRGGFDGTAAANALIAEAHAVGIYDPDRIRGRGAWWDEGRAVLHLGNGMIVDGNPTGIMAHRSYFLYEQAQACPVHLAAPLSAAEARKLFDICKLARWDDPGLAPLFAGFLVVAPVCGAMPWRAHGWLTGEKGSGKTWILDNIARAVIGTIALRVSSKTTEAGVRQLLGADGRPVVFDEAETQNQQDRERVQLILDLARQASSEDAAPIVKGTQSGRAQTFSIRSSFLFSSINLALHQAADESRTLVFSLQGRGNLSEEGALAAAEQFAELQRLVTDTLTPEWCGGLLARTLSLLGVIRANAQTFARAVSERSGSQRHGDTVGGVLAGFHSLFSSKTLTIDEARTFLDRSWARRAGEDDTAPDQDRALDHLLEQMIRVQPGSGAAFERPVASLVAAVAGGVQDLTGKLTGDAVDGVFPDVAEMHLLHLGLRVDPSSGMLWAARSHSRLSALFRDTPWASAWETQLGRVNGAVKTTPKSMRFGKMVKRAVGVPLSEILKPEQ